MPINKSFLLLLILLLIWEAIWKGIALWKAAKNNHLKWFIAIFAINSAGILPLLYLKFFQEKKTETGAEKVDEK